MIGKRFGRLVVLELDEEQTLKNKNHAKSYKCKCDCGNVKTVRKSNLNNGAARSCGCLVKEEVSKTAKNQTIDITGQRFGKLVITRRKENDSNDPIKQRRFGAWWYADCDCGTKDVIVKGTYLRSGRVQSCGCYNKEASHDKNGIDLTGQKYGLLTVIEEYVPEEKSKDKRGLLWRCKCDCGNETIVSSNAIRTGETSSCGCLSSKNEMLIRNHLDKLGVRFKKQYYFDDLRSPITNWLLKFDIAVFNSQGDLCFLIEYDGEQHENGVRFASTKEENEIKFERLQLYDSLKNQYCEEHNIDLLRISYRNKKQLLDIVDEKLRQKGLII